MRWISEHKFNLLLTLVGTLILSLPIIIFGVNKSFYINPDPDVVYVGNAVLFIKSGVIAYFDHPGTPSILLFSFFSLPFAFISKYILHQSFSLWVFNNYPVLSFYLRLIQVAISSAALFIFLNLVNRIYKSNVIMLIAFLLVFTTEIFSWSAFIAPEALSVFLAVLWLTLFVKYLENRKYLFNIVLIIISGIAVANKFTNASLLLISLLIPLFIQGAAMLKKLKLVGLNFAVFIVSFFIGIIPVIGDLRNIFNWALSLITHAGKYGQGVNAVFDWQTYSNSFITLIRTFPVVFAFAAAATIFIFYLVFSGKTSKNDREVLFLYFIALFGFLIFAKYPEIHYSFINILLMIFCITFFIKKVNVRYIKILLPILTIIFLFVVSRQTTKLVIAKDEADKDITNGYMYHALETWTPKWAGNVFSEEINGVTPETPLEQ